jgi:hypothetical protein
MLPVHSSEATRAPASRDGGALRDAVLPSTAATSSTGMGRTRRFSQILQDICSVYRPSERMLV